MKPGLRLILLGLLAASTVAVMWVVGHRATPQQAISLRPILDRATEAKAAVNQVGLMTTQVSIEEEAALGSRLAGQFDLVPLAQERGAASQWLNLVAARLAAKGGLRRPGFHVTVQLVECPQINAFALPGGRLFVTTALLDFLQTEAEAAAVLGHELAHVDLGHCIGRYQYELHAKKLGGVPLGALASLGAALMLQGYRDEQELEADRWGMGLSAAAGYHPQAGEALFRRFAAREVQAVPPRSLPGEAVAAVLDGLDDYLATHPSGPMRRQNLERAMTEARLDLDRGRFYVGRENRRRLKSRDQWERPEEFIQGRLANNP